MAQHPKPEDQLKNVLVHIDDKVRISAIVSIFFFALSLAIGLILALAGVKASAFLPIYWYFISAWLFDAITVLLLVLSLIFVYGRLGKDNESASSSALVIGVVAILTGNITAGVILLISRQFLLTRLDLHYNFK